MTRSQTVLALLPMLLTGLLGFHPYHESPPARTSRPERFRSKWSPAAVVLGVDSWAVVLDWGSRMI